MQLSTNFEPNGTWDSFGSWWTSNEEPFILDLSIFQPDDTLWFPDGQQVLEDDWTDEWPVPEIDGLAAAPWTEPRSEPRALESLISVMGDLQLDTKSGGTRYVGPTSNLHVAKTSSESASAECSQPLPGTVDEVPYLPLAEDQVALSSFWANVHPYFPLFGADTEQHKRQAWPVPVYCMMAVLGSMFLDHDESQSAIQGIKIRVDYYMARFLTVLGREVDNICLSNIQAFLLRAYLAVMQSNVESANIFTGIACGMAKRMGLHVKPADGKQVWSVADERAREAAFHACCWMDRRVGVLEGRAPFMHRCDISLQLPLESLKNDTSVPFFERELSLELLYACHIGFYDMQDKVLSKLYSFTNILKKEDAISKGHLELSAWYSSLPASIRNVAKGQSFHPSFLSFHMVFHTGLILLHRPSLLDSGNKGILSSNICRQSAKIITSLLKKYREHFDNRVADFMVIHSAFTAGLVHLVLVEYPDIATYYASTRRLRRTIDTLKWLAIRSEYARRTYEDIRNLAMAWKISPANSQSFWGDISD